MSYDLLIGEVDETLIAYLYRDEELVGVTILHVSEIGQQGETGSK